MRRRVDAACELLSFGARDDADGPGELGVRGKLTLEMTQAWANSAGEHAGYAAEGARVLALMVAK